MNERRKEGKEKRKEKSEEKKILLTPVSHSSKQVSVSHQKAWSCLLTFFNPSHVYVYVCVFSWFSVHRTQNSEGVESNRFPCIGLKIHSFSSLSPEKSNGLYFLSHLYKCSLLCSQANRCPCPSFHSLIGLIVLQIPHEYFVWSFYITHTLKERGREEEDIPGSFFNMTEIHSFTLYSFSLSFPLFLLPQSILHNTSNADIGNNRASSFSSTTENIFAN